MTLPTTLRGAAAAPPAPDVSRLPRAALGAMVAVAAGVVPLTAALLVDRGLLSRHWWDNWGYDLMVLICAVVVAGRGATVRAGRVGWLLIAAGMFSASAGNLYYVLAGYDVAGSPPSPSVPDLLWLSAYPVQALGVLVLALSGVHRFRGSAVLDAVTAAISTSSLSAFVFPR